MSCLMFATVADWIQRLPCRIHCGTARQDQSGDAAKAASDEMAATIHVKGQKYPFTLSLRP